MIDCEKIGQIKISGSHAELLAEFGFITDCLLQADFDKEGNSK